MSIHHALTWRRVCAWFAAGRDDDCCSANLRGFPLLYPADLYPKESRQASTEESTSFQHSAYDGFIKKIHAAYILRHILFAITARTPRSACVILIRDFSPCWPSLSSFAAILILIRRTAAAARRCRNSLLRSGPRLRQRKRDREKRELKAGKPHCSAHMQYRTGISLIKLTKKLLLRICVTLGRYLQVWTYRASLSRQQWTPISFLRMVY